MQNVEKITKKGSKGFDRNRDSKRMYKTSKPHMRKEARMQKWRNVMA